MTESKQSVIGVNRRCLRVATLNLIIIGIPARGFRTVQTRRVCVNANTYITDEEEFKRSVRDRNRYVPAHYEKQKKIHLIPNSRALQLKSFVIRNARFITILSQCLGLRRVLTALDGPERVTT